VKPGYKVALFVLLVGSLSAGAYFMGLDKQLMRLAHWVKGAGIAGAFVFAAIYIACTVALIPGSLVTLAAGVIYGPAVGLLIVSPASVAGATLAFLLGRFVCRDWVERKAATNIRFAALDNAVGERDKRVLVMVLLMRLSPLFPFSLLNYALGLTRLRLSYYIFASLVGMLPGTFMYVYLGAQIGDLATLSSGASVDTGTGGTILKWTGLVMTVVVTVLITRFAQKTLGNALDEQNSESGTAEEAAG
jgi:uncharacterized membrane protein YdjX (TVP38/TMEM64 family)